MASHRTELWNRFIGLIHGQTAMQRPPQLGHFLLLTPPEDETFLRIDPPFAETGVVMNRTGDLLARLPLGDGSGRTVFGTVLTGHEEKS